MKYTENQTGINLNIQAVDITIGEDIKEAIGKVISRLSRYFERIEYADVFLEDKEGKATQNKQVSIRLGVPGNDVFASAYGDDFHKILSEVEEKLRRQLEKK